MDCCRQPAATRLLEVLDPCDLGRTRHRRFLFPSRPPLPGRAKGTKGNLQGCHGYAGRSAKDTQINRYMQANYDSPAHAVKGDNKWIWEPKGRLGQPPMNASLPDSSDEIHLPFLILNF